MGHPESDFTAASDFCPHPERWTAEDNQATEDQVLELISALVIALQPDYCIETGSYIGMATERIAAALTRNGHGRLTSLEVSPSKAAIAASRVERFDCVEVINRNSLLFNPKQPIDFAWIDSGRGGVRAEEILHFHPWFHYGTVIAIHDTAPHHPDIATSIADLIQRGYISAVNLPTPRGICICNVITGTMR